MEEVQFEFECFGRTYQYVHIFGKSICESVVRGKDAEGGAIILVESDYNRVFFYGRSLWLKRRMSNEC